MFVFVRLSLGGQRRASLGPVNASWSVRRNTSSQVVHLNEMLDLASGPVRKEMVQ